MKILQLWGVALGVVLTVSASVAAQASAVTLSLAEWLVNGTQLAEGQELATETVGTVLLEDRNTSLGASDIICSGVLEGTIGFDGLGVISELLSLGSVAISKVGLSGEALLCESVSVCEEALVWAIHLPWNTLLRLMEDGTEKFFVDNIENSGAGNPGWETECMKTILKPVDECTFEGAVSQLTLENALLLTSLSDAFTELAELKLATCSLGGAETGIAESGPNETRLEGGGTLSPSTEGEGPTFSLAEWLVNGTQLAEGQELATETVGTVLLEDRNTPLGASDIICSGVLEGTIGFDGLGVISELLSLGSVAISKVGLSGEALLCESVSVCEEALVWAIHLPWNTLLRLMEDGTEKFFVDNIENSGAGNPGWETECMKTILKPVDECTFEGAVSQLTLENALLLTSLSDAFTELAELKLATCSLGGAETGIAESGPNETRLEGGGTLSPSTEGEGPTFSLAEWLVNGTQLAEGQELATETVGTVLLEDRNTPLGASDIICSGVLEGTIGFDGLGVISELLSLGSVAISKVGLSGEALLCESVSVCEEALVWAIHLPWNTLLRLMEDGTEKFFVDNIENSGAGNPGWETECMKTILKPVDECTFEGAVSQLTLENALLLTSLSDAFTELAELKLATCSLGGAETGIAESGPNEIELAAGGTLSASSEVDEA